MEDYKFFLDNGIEDLHKGNFPKALENINKSLELKNDWEIPYFYRAVAHQALENFEEAKKDYAKAIELNEKMTDAYYNRARITLTDKSASKEEIQAAVKDLEKALEQDEKFLDALYAMAAAHKKLGNYKTALDYLDKLIEIEPEAINARAFKKLLQQKYL